MELKELCVAMWYVDGPEDRVNPINGIESVYCCCILVHLLSVPANPINGIERWLEPRLLSGIPLRILNPINGIESHTQLIVVWLVNHYLESNKWNWKPTLCPELAVVAPHMNPINGIERNQLGLGLDPFSHLVWNPINGIESENSVVVGAPRHDTRNPINGIESISCLKNWLLSPSLRLNPINGIES